MASIGQSSSDIRKRLQHLEILKTLSLQHLFKESEKVYHKRETKNEKGEREERVAEAREGRPDGMQDRNLIRILDTLAVDKEVYRKDGGNRQTG